MTIEYKDSKRLVGLGSSDKGTITLDARASVSNSGTQGTTMTRTITIGTGSKRALFVCLNTDPSVTVSHIKLDGVAFTEISGTVRTDVGRNSIWQLMNPASGAGTITVTWGASAGYVGMSAISFTGVDQTTPVNTGNITSSYVSTGGSGTQTVSITPANTGSAIFGYVVTHRNVYTSTGSGSIASTFLPSGETSSTLGGAGFSQYDLSPTIGSANNLVVYTHNTATTNQDRVIIEINAGTLADVKPTNVQDNSIFVEKDTGERYWSSATLKIDTDFSTNTGWDQEGTEIAINTGTGKLDWIGLRSSTNTGISYDFGAGRISTSKWRLQFDLYIQNFSGSSYTQRFGWMLSTKGSADNSDQLRDFIGGRVSYRGQAPTSYQQFNTIDDQGSTVTWADNTPYQPAQGTDNGVTPVAGTTYNIVLTRDSATAYTMTISSGGALIDTLNYTSYAGTSDLRYLLIQRYGDGASAGSSFNGTIDNLKFYNGVTSATPTTWTNGTPFYPYIDNFSTDKGWVTTNSTKYNYNSSGYIYFDAASTQQDARISFDLGADNILSNTAWVMRWKQNITTYAQGAEAQHLSFTIALSKDDVNATTNTAYIALGHASNSGVTYYKEGHNTNSHLQNVTGGTSLSEVPAANVRYVEMIRKNATQFSIRITANSDYSGGSFIDNQDCTGIADLRYVVLVNNSGQAAGSARWTGQFSELSIYNGVNTV